MRIFVTKRGKLKRKSVVNDSEHGFVNINDYSDDSIQMKICFANFKKFINNRE
jgi:hypothetical protein